MKNYELKNLPKDIIKTLNSIGIHNRDDLKRVGVKKAYLYLLEMGYEENSSIFYQLISHTLNEKIIVISERKY